MLFTHTSKHKLELMSSSISTSPALVIKVVFLGIYEAAGKADMLAMQSLSWKRLQHVPPLHECLFVVLVFRRVAARLWVLPWAIYEEI